MESQWWYAKNNEKVGPISRIELIQQVADHNINLDTLVWQAGWEQWRKIAEVEELRADIAAVLADQHNSIPPPLPAPAVEGQQQALTEPTDLASKAFVLRAVGLFGGFTLFAFLITGHFFVALGQAAGIILQTLTIFLIVWSFKRLLGRRMRAPFRDAFYFGIFMVALYVVSLIIDLRASQIAG